LWILEGLEEGVFEGIGEEWIFVGRFVSADAGMEALGFLQNEVEEG